MRTQTTSNETVEMYLKTIAELSDDDTPVVIARVAERLGVSPVSANEMMKRLVEQELLVHERYKGVMLTENGRFYANSVIRRQRLWECFLVDRLNFNWSGAYDGLIEFAPGLWGHRGQTVGFTSIVAMDPDKDFLMIALANSAEAAVGDEQRLIGHYLRLDEE